MSDFSQALARYIDTMANPSASISDEMQAAEALCASIETEAQAQIAFNSMDDASRVMGSHVADNATDSAYHPFESSGIAYTMLEDGFAILASWSDQGFWDIDLVTIADAENAIEQYNAEYELDEDETHWAQ